MEEKIIDYGNDIKKIAQFISEENIVEARKVAQNMPKRIKKKKIENANYKSSSIKNSEARKYTEIDLMNVFIKDGFIDRYTGLKLVIPPALRIISETLPFDFPYHKNWAKGKCHDSYWDLSATADHIKPVADYGTDALENLVSTSMSKNLQKNSISLEDLGWKLFEVGNLQIWDGLCEFYVTQCNKNPSVLQKRYYKKWYTAIERTLKK